MADKKVKEEVLLQEKEVWDVIEFARSMSGMYNSYINPELINARMRDITLNPMQASQDELNRALLDPKSNEFQLQRFSESFELQSMPYKRLISYLSNMLAWDITYTANVEASDYSAPKYKKDLKAVETFLDCFNYKQEFRVVVKEMLRHDAYFGCFRQVGDEYVLQELPSEYCKITGRWRGGFVFSFNMYWFLQPGVEIEDYPPFFKKKYKEIWGDANNPKAYNPALGPELRGSSSWIYWQDIPVDVGVCFKLTPELSTRLPYFTPLFNDLILQPLIRNLQKNINMAAAAKMIMGEVPMLDKTVKASVKDTMAISPELLGRFMGLVKNAVTEAVTVAAAPLTNIEGISFDGDNLMYDQFLRTALASSGVNTNLVFSSSIKPNAIETQLSLNVDEQLMMVLYEQFNEAMNYWASKITRTFKFMFVFEGTDFFLDRDARIKKVMDLLEKGIVMPQKIAAAHGMKPAQMRRHMEEAAATGFMKMLTPPAFEQQKEIAQMAQDAAMESQKLAIKSAPKPATTTPTAKKPSPTGGTKPKSPPASSAPKGRPKKPLSELGEEGQNTRAGATNVGRGGKA